MLSNGQSIDLFKLQKELVEAQVDMAVSRSTDRVVDQINALRNEMNTQIQGLKGEMNSQIHAVREDMHELRHEMRDEFASLKTRVTAVETKLGIVSESRKEVRSHFVDYCFKAGWLILASVVSSVALLLHQA
jgi:uncharacterized coiled-coil DUF342 family protein